MLPTRLKTTKAHHSTGDQKLNHMDNQTRPREIEEEAEVISPESGEDREAATPLSQRHRDRHGRSVNMKVPEVEIHLYRRGQGPIDVFKSSLGGWEQEQLEVRDILEKYGFKSIYAFNTESGRCAPIRFNQRNGRSMLTYKDGSIILIDGEPKDSMIKPITRILIGLAVMTFMIALVMKEKPEWVKKMNSDWRVPPWILACVVIIFTRLRKRTRDFLKKRGW